MYQPSFHHVRHLTAFEDKKAMKVKSQAAFLDHFIQQNELEKPYTLELLNVIVYMLLIVTLSLIHL